MKILGLLVALVVSTSARAEVFTADVPRAAHLLPSYSAGSLTGTLLAEHDDDDDDDKKEKHSRRRDHDDEDERFDGPLMPTGKPLIITGAVLGGIGVIGVATGLVLLTSFGGLANPYMQPVATLELVLGGIFIAAGVPMFVVGMNQSAAYYEELRRMRRGTLDRGSQAIAQGPSLGWTFAL
jgi:hypothetical protein